MAAAGVPLSAPAELNVTPLGKVPVSVNIGVGYPVAVTVNEPEVPTVKVVLLALVIAGAWPTVNVKLCVAFEPTPLLAVMVMGKLPVVVAVPLSAPAELKVTPLGNEPVSVNVGAGYPVAVTVNEPAVLTVKVVLEALVIAGACLTVGVKLCVPAGETPLLAEIVIA